MAGRPRKGRATGDNLKLNIGIERKLRIDAAMKEAKYRGTRQDFLIDIIDQAIESK